MSKHPVFHWLPYAMVIASLLMSACPPIQAPPADAPPPSDVDAIIQNAMSAALPAIGKDATIMGWSTTPDGDLVELRKGSNGWTCFPDDPNFPTNDPMCLDAMWMEWFRAYSTQTEPHYTTIGIGYMLQGGSAASNEDPYAMEPAAGHEWMIDPPHLMIVAPEKWDITLFSTDPNSGGPYIMWAGTPYEHLMVPAQREVTEQLTDQLQNAMSAAPSALAKDATVMGWSDTGNGELIELQKGSNGWTCMPDDPNFPTNDPMCLDTMWMEWFMAYTTGTEPHYTAVGISYMLQSGSAASNEDPYLAEPPADQGWLIDPPHVMLVTPEKWDPTLFSTDPNSGGPYIMWVGTPFEHLMVPVAEVSE